MTEISPLKFGLGNKRYLWGILMLSLLLIVCTPVNAQLDQGGITGVVQDANGASIVGAQIKLTNTDTGLVLEQKANESGIYLFASVKTGHYEISATAPGFEAVVQKNLLVQIQERLNVALTLKPGAVSDILTVSTAPPLLQTQSGAIGEVISTQTINSTPIDERNWTYISQYVVGVTPAFGADAAGTGDIEVNGQRATENYYILDGIDNNSHSTENGLSVNILPPPDALSEFKIQTGNYSAEFGRGSGAVVNASLKAGTNKIHGDLWEYDRNTILDAKDWDQTAVPSYHENQFGATLGFPILRNKLFYFGDFQEGITSYSATGTYTVPTALERQGNFSELLNPALTGEAGPVQLYQPNSGGTTKVSCNGANNVFCPDQLDKVALNILSLYPAPNTNDGMTTNNLLENLLQTHNIWQWDQRLDWNISAKDQAYSSYSYFHVQNYYGPPLGNVLDGGGGSDNYLSQSGMGSEMHAFSTSFTNEFRFGFNWGNYRIVQTNFNQNESDDLGLGGVPFNASLENGGLPNVEISGITTFGSGTGDPDHNIHNVYEILDNVTKNIGNHSMRMGIDFESIRTYGVNLSAPRGQYDYTGIFTSYLNQALTGSGIADFLTNQMANAGISNTDRFDLAQWYRSGYFQDDWRVTRKLTLNLGIRYEYFQPFRELRGQEANLVATSVAVKDGTGTFTVPTRGDVTISPAFATMLASSNISVQSSNNPALQNVQKNLFSPRLGFAYQPHSGSVIHGGFGMYYGSRQDVGLSSSYPFLETASYIRGSCALNKCPSIGVTLEQGLATQLAAGLDNVVASPSLTGADTNLKNNYAILYNLTVQQELAKNLVFSLGYVGDLVRRMPASVNPNAAVALGNSTNTITNLEPFPLIGTFSFTTNEGKSEYNGLQASVKKRFSGGLSFLASYTWAHTMDDYITGLREYNMIPMRDEFTNNADDFKNRFTAVALYELPFGRGRARMNHSTWTNLFAGGWNISGAFQANSGRPFTVTPNNTAVTGGARRAILVRNPFTPGGAPDPSNATIVCPAQVRNRTHWYNPCAFANPLAGTTANIPAGTTVTGVANAVAYLGGEANQITGPGLSRLDSSVFKNFPIWRQQYLQFRADIFNVLNHPSLDIPSLTGINSTAGQITSPQSLENREPDSRFFQLSAKYVF